MQNLRQQYGPAVVAMPHVKPSTHGDSGTRSHSSELLHSAVQRPMLAASGMLPGGSSRVGGKRRHVRDTQSSDCDATTTWLACGVCSPRSHFRPTGLLVQPDASAANTTIDAATDNSTPRAT